MFLLLYAIAIVIALLLQTSPLFGTAGTRLHVDTTLLVVVYFNLFWRGQRPLLLGFLSGLLQDALSSEVFGLSALSKTLIAFLTQTLCRNVQIQSLLAQCLFTGLAVGVDMVSRMLITFVLQFNTVDPRFLLSTLPQQTLLSLCLVPVVCRGLHALAKGLRIRQEIAVDSAV
jgi:rod shape-determining protein MreD